jgi:hypothetical protein
VKIVSRYVADETRCGHPCAHITCTVSSIFQVTAPGGKPIEGKLSGTISYWLARDLGQDVETQANLLFDMSRVEARSGTDTRVTRTLEFVSKQQLTK